MWRALHVFCRTSLRIALLGVVCALGAAALRERLGEGSAALAGFLTALGWIFMGLAGASPLLALLRMRLASRGAAAKPEPLPPEAAKAPAPKAPKRAPRKPRFDPEALPSDGLAFEAWVAESLRVFGWEAETTPSSGDQGLDVIARRNGRRLGVQCKLYSAPIGNRAVQEAHAGKAFHRVDAAVVLSNARFTPSAQALATATGVRLFGPGDIPQLYEKTFGRLRDSA